MSKNLNRRFFYDFLLALAKEYEVNPDAIETPFIIGRKKKFFQIFFREINNEYL